MPGAKLSRCFTTGVSPRTWRCSRWQATRPEMAKKNRLLRHRPKVKGGIHEQTSFRPRDHAAWDRCQQPRRERRQYYDAAEAVVEWRGAHNGISRSHPLGNSVLLAKKGNFGQPRVECGCERSQMERS